MAHKFGIGIQIGIEIDPTIVLVGKIGTFDTDSDSDFDFDSIKVRIAGLGDLLP